MSDLVDGENEAEIQFYIDKIYAMDNKYVTPLQKNFLIYLAFHHKNVPSQQIIARQTSTSRSTVNRIMKQLAYNNFIEVSLNADTNPSLQYSLNMEKILECQCQN